MKKNALYLLSTAAIVCAIFFSSCTDQCQESYSYIEYQPHYVNQAQMRTSFDILPPKPIHQSGKIYLYGSILFVAEPNKGIHVIDNSDPENPVTKNFIELEGARDVAVKGNYMYADSYMDLVVLNISDLENIQLEKRIEDVFGTYYYVNDEGLFISHYTETATIQRNDIDCTVSGNDIFLEGDVIFMSDANNFGGIANVSGISGSMARMNIVGDYLYGIDDYKLNVFNVATPSNPIEINEVDAGWSIETLFPHEDNLFVGAADGMYIFDNSSPTAPVLLSKFNHARACDPVVVQDDIAYVTLRNGTECDGFINQLDVVDVSDLTDPKLMYTHEMDNPHGLGVDGDKLFICEGEFGLKLFDKSDLSQIGDKLQNWIQNIHAFDVIPLGELLILIGEDGLYQFNYADPTQITFLSKIEIGG